MTSTELQFAAALSLFPAEVADDLGNWIAPCFGAEIHSGRRAMRRKSAAVWVLLSVVLALVGIACTSQKGNLSQRGDASSASSSVSSRNDFSHDDDIRLITPRFDEVERLNNINYFRGNFIHFDCTKSGCDGETLVVNNAGAVFPGRKHTSAELKNLGLDPKTVKLMSVQWSHAERDEFVCMLARAEFQQSIFNSILVATPDAVGVSQYQDNILLPTQIPSGCKLPPDSGGFR